MRSSYAIDGFVLLYIPYRFLAHCAPNVPFCMSSLTTLLDAAQAVNSMAQVVDSPAHHGNSDFLRTAQVPL
jgi:hypothetical protein